MITRHKDAGVTSVEFALIVLIILIISLGAVDFGLWMFQKSEAAQAAREASRVAMINPPSVLDTVAASTPVAVTSGSVFAAATDEIEDNLPNFAVTVACSAKPCVSGDDITVTVSWHRDPLTFVGVTDTVSANSTRTVVGVPKP